MHPDLALQPEVQTHQEGEYRPTVNDDLTSEMHLKTLQKEEKSRNRRQSVVMKLMEEMQLYRETEIRSLEAAHRVKEMMTKYKCLQMPAKAIT